MVAALHLAALSVLLATEYGPFAITLSVLAWVFINCLFLLVLPRPGVSAALALALVVLLIALSRFKFDILQLSLTFLDFLIIDRDTFSFLLSVFPRLRTQLIVAAVLAVPVLWLIWRADPFRAGRRLFAGGSRRNDPVDVGDVGRGARAAVGAVPGRQSYLQPRALGRRGGVAADLDGMDRGRSACERPLAPRAHAAGRPALPPGENCDTTVKRPHIIMLLDESSFDVTAAPGVKVPEGYADFFKSIDGVRRTMIAEATGGPTWYTEFNVLTGMSARSFGDLKFYVTRITAGRVTRGLPQALQRCGYKTVSLYPTYGDFLGARTFQKGVGVEQFIDMADMGVDEDMQPDKFYFDQALKVFAAHAAVAVAGLHVRVPHGQSFSLDQRLSARSDAGLDAAGQYRGDR